MSVSWGSVSQHECSSYKLSSDRRANTIPAVLVHKGIQGRLIAWIENEQHGPGRNP